MRRHHYCLPLLCLLHLCACATLPDAQELDGYDRLAKEGDLEEAERGYDGYLALTPLEEEQWQEVRKRRCAVTAARVRADFEALKQQAPAGTLPDRQALHDLLMRGRACGEVGEANREIEAMMIARTEEDVKREIQPLYDAGQYLAMSSKAPAFSPMLPKDHRYAKWFIQVRAIMGEKLDAWSSEKLMAGYPATSFYYGMVRDELVGKATNEKMPPDVRAAFTSRVGDVLLPTITYQIDQIELGGTLGACAPLFHARSVLPEGPLSSPLGIKVDAKATFSSCDVSILQVEPQPTGFSRVVVQVNAKVDVLASVVGDGEEVKNTVDLEESHTFNVPGVVTTPQQALDAVIAARGGVATPYPFDVSLTNLLMRDLFPTMFSAKQVRQGLHHSAMETDDASHRAERMLAALLSAPDDVPADYASTIEATLGVDPSPYPNRMLQEPRWLYTTDYEPIPRRRWDREFVIARQKAGVPTNVVEIGGSYGLPEQGLVGQPDRSALALDVRSLFRFPLLMPKGRFLNYGLIFGFEGGFWAGKRFGEDYQDVTDPGYAVYEPEEEMQAFGFHLAAAAMLGRRGRRLGLFAGIKPDFMHRGFGFYRNQGARTPLMGRLELRLSPARSIVVEAWGGNINATSKNSSYGGSIWLPFGTSTTGLASSGLALRAQQDVLPAVFYGLNQTDDVRIEETTLRSANVSYFFGF